MPKTRQEKEKLITETLRKLDDVKTVIFANFSGLKVKDSETLRKKCRAEGVNFEVVKKTLFKIALEKKGFKDYDAKMLAGEIAVFYGADEVRPAKILYDFAKDNETLQISGGILEGKFASLEEIIVLAKLPSRDELLAKMVGSIKAPVSDFVNVLTGNLRGLVQVLRSIRS